MADIQMETQKHAKDLKGRELYNTRSKTTYHTKYLLVQLSE